MKRVGILLVMLLLAITMTGCINPAKGAFDISKMSFIKTIAVDKVAGQDKIRITVGTKFASSGGEPGGASKKTAHVYGAEGETLFEASRNLYKVAEKDPFWGHVEYILIGEDLAKEGIGKYLDFFSREHQFRLNAKVIVVKGDTAQNVLEKAGTSEQFVSDRLQTLLSGATKLSNVTSEDLHRVTHKLETPSPTLSLPAISLTKAIKKGKPDEEKIDILLDTIAVFNGDKLFGYIDGDLAKGLNWITGNIDSGVMTVMDETYNKIGLEISDSHEKIAPKIDKSGNLTVEVKIEVDSSIAEIESRKDIFSPKSFSFLSKEQSEKIKAQVEAIIDYSQKNNLDIINLYDTIYHKYPIKSKELRHNWSKVFPTVPFNVAVQCDITRTYSIRQPMGSKEKDK